MSTLTPPIPELPQEHTIERNLPLPSDVQDVVKTTRQTLVPAFQAASDHDAQREQQTVARPAAADPRPVEVPAIPSEDGGSREKLRTVRERLRKTAGIVNDLIRHNMEHRVHDMRDRIPIWASVRSHHLATLEGELIDRLKRSSAGLASDAAGTDLAADATALAASVNALRKPEGFTKWMATIFGWRALHRMWTAPRYEEIKRKVAILEDRCGD